LQRAELSGQADSENNLGGSSETMYFIGLDAHKKTISISENSLVVSELSPKGRTGLNLPCYHPLIRLAHRLEPRRSR
ncbi:MAG: hypothetical protein WA869_24000, partial [Alloacidobacterium sp.]